MIVSYRLCTANLTSGGQCQILVDNFHHKAPGTLLKRCNSIGRFVNDLHAHQLNFPCSETELHDHLCRQKGCRGPIFTFEFTYGSNCFCQACFGCESLDLAIKNRRCMGAASSKEGGNHQTGTNADRGAPQASALSCPVGIRTHGMLRSVAWCFSANFGRARWSDAKHSQFLEWDMDTDGNICFVECCTAVYKTCRALNMRHSFLRLTAPGIGTTEDCWAACWLRARADFGYRGLGLFYIDASSR